MRVWWGLVILSLLIRDIGASRNKNVGPWVESTKGELLPRAFEKHVNNVSFILRPLTFQFITNEKPCDIIDDAVNRYRSILLTDARLALKAALPLIENSVGKNDFSTGELIGLNINWKNPCEKYPHLKMQESYFLKIDEDTKFGYLEADEVWGILRGLETFSQLVSASSNGRLTIKSQEIKDKPRFPHRGLLLDTARHYLPVSDILMTLDAMSYNKLNVFHWHIVDDNSFPFVSPSLPNFSRKAAYHPTMVYEPSEVRKIVEHARLRGIRIIPEIDTPAHTQSWGLVDPEYLTECYENGKPNGKRGPLQLLNSKVWEAIIPLWGDALTLFPDRYIHLGGDEVSFDCWASNPQIMEYMKKSGLGEDFTKLEAKYFVALSAFPSKINVTSIVWQEVFQNVKDLTNDMVVQIWITPWQSLMEEVVSKNYSALLSACWYLSDVGNGGDWTKYYICDPLDFNGTSEMKSRVLGGEACMWGEFVDRTNVHQRIWPRASAAAERLWSYEAESLEEMAKRMEEHSCRMNRRGIPAQPPNGPSFCVL